MASRIRQLIVSLDVMTASHKHISQKMKAIELIGNVTSHGGSTGSSLPTPHWISVLGSRDTINSQ
jgi:hypothetical protein